MSLIDDLPKILNESKREYEKICSGVFTVTDEIRGQKDEAAPQWENMLALGDNARWMKTLTEERDMAGKIQMVYIDPPFFTKASYDAVLRPESKKIGKISGIKHFAYDDMWEQGLGEYLKMLCVRLLLIRDLLTDSGTVWVHLDWHASHYVRILMDEVFGAEHFVNEIVWMYKSGGTSRRHFARKHDNILVYSKEKDYYFRILKEKSYNRGLKPYRFKGVEEFEDETGWYTLVNMKDVWQIDMVGRTSAERTGYATQKPEALISRIIQCSTREGDICADLFCGSGTLASAAQQLNRRWICCDSGRLAVSCTMKRVLSCETAAPMCLLTEDAGTYMEKCDSGKQENRGNIDADISLEGKSNGNGEFLKICLTGYEPEMQDEHLDEEGIAAIRRLAEEDPLQLIDYWSIDTDYDGIVHRPRMFFAREKGRLNTECEFLADEKGSGEISIKATDILGNTASKILERKGSGT